MMTEVANSNGRETSRLSALGSNNDAGRLQSVTTDDILELATQISAEMSDASKSNLGSRHVSDTNNGFLDRNSASSTNSAGASVGRDSDASTASSVFIAEESAADVRPVSYVQAISEQDEPTEEARNGEGSRSAVVPVDELVHEAGPVVEEEIEPVAVSKENTSHTITTDAIANLCASLGTEQDSYENTVMVREATGTLRRIEAENELKAGIVQPENNTENTLPEDSEVTITTEEQIAINTCTGKNSDEVQAVEIDPTVNSPENTAESTEHNDVVSGGDDKSTHECGKIVGASDSQNKTTAQDSEDSASAPSISVEDQESAAKSRSDSIGNSKIRKRRWTNVFKPWKWRRKRPSAKIATTAQALERRISQRPTRDQVLATGIVKETDVHEAATVLPPGERSATGESDGGDAASGVKKMSIVVDDNGNVEDEQEFVVSARGLGRIGSVKGSAVQKQLERRISLRSNKDELAQKNIFREETEEEASERKASLKAILKRRLSQRTSVKELKEKKILQFDQYVDVFQTYTGGEYYRGGPRPWTRLTTADKIRIKKELNDFKHDEMDVHPDSAKFTRFHK
eukprot:m.1119356 g.1119356  ORF g.1119356 m.1119356 type:complete len:575 (-) comp24390_c0_seq2:2011-3735(-)